MPARTPAHRAGRHHRHLVGRLLDGDAPGQAPENLDVAEQTGAIRLVGLDVRQGVECSPDLGPVRVLEVAIGDKQKGCNL
jgi:hypothetical protein